MSNGNRRREAVRLSDVFRKIAGMWHSQDDLVAAAAAAAATAAEKESPLMTGQFSDIFVVVFNRFDASPTAAVVSFLLSIEQRLPDDHNGSFTGWKKDVADVSCFFFFSVRVGFPGIERSPLHSGRSRVMFLVFVITSAFNRVDRVSTRSLSIV